jgi:hypothetical protein
LHHSRLNRVFDDKASNDAWAGLANTMAAVGRLPFGSGIPPAITD